MPKIGVPQEYISKLSQWEQIIELNNEVRCRLAPSKVHGVGVIAMRDIQWGERCYCTPNMIPKFYNVPFGSLSKLLPEIKELILDKWGSIVNGSIFCHPNDDQHLLMFINHTPNSEKLNYDVISDTALRKIEKGEEILQDYRIMANWEKVWPPDKNPWINEENML